MADPLIDETVQPEGRHPGTPVQVAPAPRRTPARVPPTAEGPAPVSRGEIRGLGLQAKIILLLVISLALLSLISAFATAAILQGRMTAEARAKGRAVAAGLAAAARGPLGAGDTRAVQALVEELQQQSGVDVLVVYDGSGRAVASSYGGALPAELARAPEEARAAAAPRRIPVPGGGVPVRVLEVGHPVAGGGAVRVGLSLDAIAREARRTLLDLLVIQGMVALVAVLFAVLFSARLVRPIRALVRVARAVGRGDLSHMVKVRTTDEVGLLTRTFNDTIGRLRGLVVTEAERDIERTRRETLQENIRRFLQVTLEISRGDLRRRGEVTEDVLGSVVDSINLMVEEIGHALRGAQELATTVHTSAEEMIHATTEIGAGVQEQAETARQVSGRVSEVTVSVRGVAENADASSDAARKTLDAARKGRQAVGDTLGSMQRIRVEAQGISRRIKSLGDRSLEISEIVDTIGSIASQTNLLALNAAIEASGAGEEGARFAVVADEVRKLAEESAAASKRIAALIRGVQAEIQEAVGAMEEGTQEVETGFRLAEQAGEQLAEIAEISHLSAELAERISGQTGNQVEGIEEVARSVAAIAQLAHRTDRVVEDGRQATEYLLGLARELTERLSRFRLPEPV
jgi:methyl-accepting chemotaxis protein